MLLYREGDRCACKYGKQSLLTSSFVFVIAVGGGGGGEQRDQVAWGASAARTVPVSPL
jgi:hypothetical protein